MITTYDNGRYKGYTVRCGGEHKGQPCDWQIHRDHIHRETDVDALAMNMLIRHWALRDMNMFLP